MEMIGQQSHFLTNHANMDLCEDDTSCEISSCGEAGAGFTGSISNKIIVHKGCNNGIVRDIH